MNRLLWIPAVAVAGVAFAFALAVVIGGSPTSSTGPELLWTNGQFSAHTQQVGLTILPVSPVRGMVDDRVVEPNVAVQPGVAVTITATNYTTVVHTFTVPGLGVNFAILPGTKGKPVKTSFTFTPTKRGAFEWFCHHCPGHMTGTVYAIIGQASRAGAA